MDFKVIIVILLCINKLHAEQCTTPNEESAECISLYSCPTLLDALGARTNASIEFVRKSNCGGTSLDPLVCCGSTATFSETRSKKKTVVKQSLLASKRFCGLQHVDDYERDTTHITGITEFPWMARIEYQIASYDPDPSQSKSFVCSGSLINNKYILTARYCAKRAIGVRLGEYSSYNETDCVHEFGIEECSSPVEDYGIEKIITHPDYKIRINDIALIRLNKSVTYTDYIRPICLPTKGTKPPQIGDILVSSGWGHLQQSVGTLADAKKKITSRLITQEECAERYGDQATIVDTHLCIMLTGNDGEAQCVGDGGGPVMFARQSQWYQEGIISFGSSACGNTYPEVNTRVASYIDWIEENMEA